MVEGAKRQKTPNELALTILLVSLTIILMLATVTLLPYSLFSEQAFQSCGMQRRFRRIAATNISRGTLIASRWLACS